MNKVLWFSRHPMTEEQKASLGECEITQVNKSIRSAKELEQEISENDIIAVSYTHLFSSFIEALFSLPKMKSSFSISNFVNCSHLLK